MSGQDKPCLSPRRMPNADWLRKKWEDSRTNMSAEGRSGSTPPLNAAPSSDTAALSALYAELEEEWWALRNMSYWNDTADLGPDDIDHIQGLIGAVLRAIEAGALTPPEGVQPGGDPDPDSGGSV